MGAGYIHQPINFPLERQIKTSTLQPKKERIKRSISENESYTLMVTRSTQVDAASLAKTTNRLFDSENIRLSDSISEVKEDLDAILKCLGFASSVEFESSLEHTKRALKIKMHMSEIEDTIKRFLSTNNQVEIQDTLNTDSTQYLHLGFAEPLFRSCETLNYEVKKSVSTPITAEMIGDLLRLRVFPQSSTDQFPFTMNDFFIQRSTGIAAEAEMNMSLELLRLSSFCTFPKDIDISLIRLAQVGFYHTGRGKETKCYSCGVIYRDWTSGDVPIAVHKRIAPSCILNTTINDGTTITREGHQLQFQQHEDRLLVHGHSENTNIQNDHVVLTSLNSVNSCENRTHLENEQSQITLTCTQDLKSNVSRSTDNKCEHLLESSQCQQEPHVASHRIKVEKPRYPNYASLQVRVSSYQGWPSYLDQTPRQMAMAGFLFAGYNDYTRCFFCGGGLRNWEAEDDPWVEHARWFPKCAYVIQSKGEEFITAVLQRQDEIERRSESSVLISNSLPNVTISSHNNPQNDKDSQLNTVAARSVLEMGFTTNQVLNALQKIDESPPGKRNISAVEIMQIILDEKRGSMNQETESLTTATGQNAATNDLAQGNECSGAGLQQNRSREENVSLHDFTEVHLDDTALLLEENRQLREQRLCKVCLDLDATIAFLPCGHIVCCSDCAPAMRKCPICRKFVKGTVKTYIA